MKLSRFPLSLLLLAGAVSLALVPGPTAADEEGAPSIADLDWLSGAWTGGDGQSTWETSYSSPDGGQIVAASKEMRGGKTVMIDFEHFYERAGSVRMTPYPFGKKSVEFTMTEFSRADKRAVFANPEHDFPNRFTYQRSSKSSLKITLEGTMNGSPLRVDISLAR